jgi:hypothetical protein
MLSPDQIKAANDLPRETIPTPEWADGDDTSVIIRRLTAGEALALSRDAEALKAMPEAGPIEDSYGALVAAYSLCDAEGKRTVADPLEFSRVLLGKGYPPVRRVLDAAMKLSGLGKDQAEAIAKN